MKTLEIKLRVGNSKEILNELCEHYYWRFYKNAMDQVFFMYTYFDDYGDQYNTLIPIDAKNSKTLRVRVCKYYFGRFARALFDYIVEDIWEFINSYVNELEEIKFAEMKANE